MKTKNKGQAGNTIVAAMVSLLIVGFLGIVSITIYSDISSSMKTASSTSADYVIDNFSGNFYDGQDLASNIPIVLAAGLLLMVIMGFTMYLQG